MTFLSRDRLSSCFWSSWPVSCVIENNLLFLMAISTSSSKFVMGSSSVVPTFCCRPVRSMMRTTLSLSKFRTDDFSSVALIRLILIFLSFMLSLEALLCDAEPRDDSCECVTSLLARALLLLDISPLSNPTVLLASIFLQLELFIDVLVYSPLLSFTFLAVMYFDVSKYTSSLV